MVESPQPPEALASAPDSAEERAKKRQAELLEANSYAQFILHTKNEVLFVLRGLSEAVCQVTVFFNEGRDLLLTTVAAVEEDYLVLDLGASGDMNRKALSAEKLFCVAMHEKVRIQFVLRGLAKIEYEGRPAFRADLPADVLRLQRREFYRLTTPIARPLKCLIPLTDTDGNIQMLEMNVVDISGGGLALSVPEGMALERDREFPNCHIDLPEVGVVTIALKIRNDFELTLRSGNRVKRLGCEFVKIPGPMLTLIQRYIIKVERERKARESGMI